MNDVIIMSGICGSGKTTWARAEFPTATIVSATDFFERDGVYKFDGSKLDDAHADCFSRFVSAVSDTDGVVVVDNTNVYAWEIAPYVAMAKFVGRDFKIVTMLCAVEVAIRRNVHMVPRYTIERQELALRTEQIPSCWRSHMRTVRS